MGSRLQSAGILIAFLSAIILMAAQSSAQPLVALDCSDQSDIYDCAPARGGTYTYALLAPPATLNPVTALETASLSVTDHLFGTYATAYGLLGGGDLGTTPHLASVIELSEDGASLSYTLRSGAKFSDGSPITVDDILYWYHDVILNPNLANPLQESMICPSSRAPFAVEAVQERQIRVSCATPFRTFSYDAAMIPVLSKQMALDLISAQQIATAPGVTGPRAAKEFLGLAAGSDPKLRALIRSTGPFVLAEFDSQSSARFTRNPNFYETDSNGTHLPYLDALEMIIITAGGLDLQLTHFLNGLTDAMQPRTSDIAAIFSHAFSSGMAINSDIDNGTAYPGTTFVALNFDDSNPAMADAARRVNVRRALSLAIDRVAAVNNVYYGMGTPLYGPVSLSGSSQRLFFIGRGNTCETFRKLGAPCSIDASKQDVVQVRNGLRLPVKNLPPYGLTPESDEHLRCLVNYGYCLSQANALLDGEGLTDTDGDGIRNLRDGKDWRIQITTNAGGVVRPETSNVICDGWRQLGIECSSSEVAFAVLVQQILGFESWSGAILLGLTGGDPSEGVNVYECGAELHLWHASCDPAATAGPAAQDAASAEVERAFDRGFSATTIQEAQAGFDQFQIAWFESEPFMHLLTPNSLFAVRTDRLCNDGRLLNGNDNIKFRVDVAGNERACLSNAGR